SLGRRLLARTTRDVALTADGAAFLDDARDLVERADAALARARATGRPRLAELRLGAIDTAAAGLVPRLLRDLRARAPDLDVCIAEDKTARMLPKLLSGRLDLAFVRPPPSRDKRLKFRFMFHETAVVAAPTGHPLASRARLSMKDLAGATLVVPDRRTRPHSHDVTVKLFREAGLAPGPILRADEKQTILGMVAAGLGLAIVPRWASRMALRGVRFVPIARPRERAALDLLPLAAAWVRGSRDPARDAVLALVEERLAAYARGA
ncbi:MAG: LysR family substrate-binding domain-containing protein, partial [Hyphomicrobiales bacterium]|nr:LysR family substrate-binding domain-containing protein [Hyphomicrobiales bacterium]